MFSQAGFRATVGGHGAVDDTSLGAGVQNLLMFHVLYMIDQGEFQSFGWRQAAIWAVEEPESALHRNLQVRLANLLRAYALPADSRFQILLSTHNEVFVYGATAGFLVAPNEATGSQILRRPIGDLVSEASSLDVTSLPSPGLQFPFDTVVVVEGDFDSRVLRRASDLMNLCQGVAFLTPSTLDPGCPDGDTGVKKFVTDYRYVFPQRLSGHPLLVLLDWEVSDGTLNAIQAKYGDSGSVNVRKMDPAWADGAVGDTFKGIERFYSPRILEEAESTGALQLARRSSGELVVTMSDLSAAKSALAELFCSSAAVSDCAHLRPALEWVETVRKGGLL